MIVKIHKNHQGQMILAVCDSCILGKKFTEKDLQLDLTSEFYKGKETSEEELKTMLKEVYIINAVGRDCIAFLLKNKMIEKEHIITIDGIPHAQCVIVRE